MESPAIERKIWGGQDNVGNKKKDHPVDRVITWAIDDADNVEDLYANLSYAIEQLARARRAIS